MKKDNSTFHVEAAVAAKKWVVVEKHLVVLPPDSLSLPVARVIERFGGTPLQNPPSPADLARFDMVIVIEEGTPEAGEDLKVQSLWQSKSPWASLGAAFPGLRGMLDGYQTLSGILYPETMQLKPDARVDDPQLLEAWMVAFAPHTVWCLSRLLSPRKQAHTLEQLIRPDTFTRRLGIYGIGDIGSDVAIDLRRIGTLINGVSALYVGGSRTPEKVMALCEELDQINIEHKEQTNFYPVLPGQENIFFEECDAILILIGSNIPLPEKGTSVDVRNVQYESNKKILQEFISKGAGKAFDGQILMASDPVEQLTWFVYQEMRRQGIDINTHQIVGFGGMINRSRARGYAKKLDIGGIFRDSGRVFGPHGRMVIVITSHDHNLYDRFREEKLSLLTGHSNYLIREFGEKPCKGPAALIVEGLETMFGPQSRNMRIIYASPFLPSLHPGRNGAFFGSRVQYYPELEAWTPMVEQPYLVQIMDILDRVHQFVSITSDHPETLKVDPFPAGMQIHPAFHPRVWENWLNEVNAAQMPSTE